jgi:hypothetical protein
MSSAAAKVFHSTAADPTQFDVRFPDFNSSISYLTNLFGSTCGNVDSPVTPTAPPAADSSDFRRRIDTSF